MAVSQVTAVANPALLNWAAGVSVKCLQVARAVTADLPISRQQTEFAPKNLSNRSTSPSPFLPTASGGRWANREVKAFKKHH